MTEPNGAPPVATKINISAEQGLVLSFCDIAGNLLATCANWLKTAKDEKARHLEAAMVFDRLMGEMAKYRDTYLRRTQTGLVIAGANEVPKLKG